MAKGRTTPAESMREILDMALRRRQRGLLSIESQQGNILEEGDIYIENGQITYARTNQLMGQAALQAILSWRGVHFAFAANEYPEYVTTGRPDAASLIATKAQTREMSPNLPALAGQESPLSMTPPSIPQLSVRRTTQPIAHDSMNTGSLPEIRGSDIMSPGAEWIIPHRVDKEQNVLSLPLTRPQRSIYMLIDGHRSISDLARCTRKTMQEIERLVSELQERGLIRI